MPNNHLVGKTVMLVPRETERDSVNYFEWRKNGEYLRLADGDLALLYSVGRIKNWLEEGELSNSSAIFMIKTIVDDKVIGEIGLCGFNYTLSNAFVGIVIGDQQNWGKGYGTDAMQVILRYAFTMLNLNHVSLTVFEYNPRGIRSYEKAGFKTEGVQRKFINRDGRRWDMYRMGILKSEWDHMSQKG